MDKLSFLNKNDTTWPATQVGLRPVKAGLGGHEAGVFGVDDGVENTSLPYENGDERSCQKESRSVILRESIIKVVLKIKRAS